MADCGAAGTSPDPAASLRTLGQPDTRHVPAEQNVKPSCPHLLNAYIRFLEGRRRRANASRPVAAPAAQPVESRESWLPTSALDRAATRSSSPLILPSGDLPCCC